MNMLLARDQLHRLRAKAHFAESLLRNTAVIVVNDQGQILVWGESAEDLTGQLTADCIGRPLFEAISALSDPAHRAAVKDACGGRRSCLGETPVATEDGDRIYEVTYAPVEDDSGVSCALVLLGDVTERRAVRQELLETEMRFRNMADASPVLLWMSGLDSLCTFFNETWLKFTGRPLDEELGVGWAEGVHFEDFQRCMDIYEAAFSARRVFEMEYRLRRADGQYRWILDRGTPRYAPDGAFAGYIGSCVDITEHKELEARLRKAVTDRDDFLSIASHELRTPLTTLQLAIDRAARFGEADAISNEHPQLKRAISSAASQVIRMSVLVEELLDVSRAASDRIDLQVEEVDLFDVVTECAHRFADAAKHAGSNIVVRLTSNDAAKGEARDFAATGYWDRSRIERVVSNLLSNAVKYGGGKPIEVSVHTDAKRVFVTVKDEGIGIQAADQQRIFNRFERAVSTRNYGGFGLGLWIARELVNAHGGRIHLTSTPGMGSTFTVELPMQATAVRRVSSVSVASQVGRLHDS